MEQAAQKDGLIELRSAVVRGTTEIKEIRLRKPAAGELRGLVLSDLLRMDAGTVMDILPRISDPALTAHEVARLDPSDLVACAIEVAAFVMPKAMLSTNHLAAPDA